MVDRRLLHELLELSPQEPATGLWRAVETGKLLASGVLPREGRVLDLGCGDGRIALVLARRLAADWTLVGLDPDAAEVERARATGVYDVLHVADGDSVPEADASFDLVLSNSVLEHVEGIEGVLDEAARVLRPGGRLVVTVPVPEFRHLLGGPGLSGLLATGARDREAYRTAIDRRLAHVRYWSADEWTAALGRRGLRLVRGDRYMTRAEVRRWEILSNLTGGLLTRAMGASRPIDVQRRLGLRARSPRALRAVAGLVGRLAVVGLPAANRDEPGGACLLVVAVKEAR